MFIDFHCDALHRLARTGASLRSQKGSVDIKSLVRGDALCQCFAIFVDLARVDSPYDEALRQARIFKDEIKKNSAELVQVTSASGILAARDCGKIGALLTIEEGEVAAGGLDSLGEFYRLGARIMTLTWNHKNSLAYPNAYGEPPTAAVNMAGGLTAKGFEFVDEMDRIGMIVDLSHLSDRGFYDVLARSKRPPIASHSNARALCPHPRNLSDDMIRRLSAAGGVMGLNFYHAFLNPDCGDTSRISDMLAHLKYIKKVGGIDVMAIGTDFDGISGSLEIKNSGGLPLLADAMHFEGFTATEIDAVMWKNALRVLSSIK